MVGDPRWCPHPVEIMGRLIHLLRSWIESWAGENRLALRVGGIIITLTLTICSGGIGFLLERFALSESSLGKTIGTIILLIALTSCIAARSLRESVQAVSKEIPKQRIPSEKELDLARQRLANIVGREVSKLDKANILRAAAESASENFVDGVFGPIFWMLVGAFSWNISDQLPGPLAFAWIYKATSTIDSMIGYRHGKLRWLGTFGARLDDVMTWIPCRLVFITLPLISKPINTIPSLMKNAYADGSKDDSPNSGMSEAIFAYCAGVKMGGVNLYKGELKHKYILFSSAPEVDHKGVENILKLGLKLQLYWIASIVIISGILLMDLIQ